MKIKINEPCDADWKKMKIGMISRHCELCVKNVMDFTKMSREEILIYLFKNNNKSTCARMYGGQMDFHHQELEAIIEGTRKQKGNLPFVVMSLAALALLSCNGGTDLASGFNPTLGKVVPLGLPTFHDSVKQSKIDSVTRIDTTTKIDQSLKTGKIISEEPTKIICTPKKGEIERVVDVLMGDVIAIETGEIELHEPIVAGNVIVNKVERAIEIAEVMPEFVGGMDSLMSYLSKNINYPKKAQKLGIEGRVFLQFIVEKDGSITNSKILRGIEKSMDKEAMRVVNAMPSWIPGNNRGEVVAVKYTLPIKFVIE
jgi:TonB family protein